jgi:hypothetical protein
MVTPFPAVPAADRPAARARQGPQHAAYARYVRLHRSLGAMPEDHPGYQPLALAVRAADAHWRALTAARRLPA